jgi:(E)-4-hydroxy-3-methylbut-2-enyl-diphosphate synthase
MCRSAAMRPVTVQTMTNTITADARATIEQIRRCEEAGADIIRVSCPDVRAPGAEADRPRLAGADRRRHPLPL